MRKTAVSEYGFINAKLRARISRILTDDFRRALSGADDIEAAVQVLAANGYESAAAAWNSTGDIQSLEFVLFSNLINNYKTVLKSTFGDLREFTNVLCIKPEIENIKTALRLWYGSRIRNRPIGYRASYIYKDRIYEVIDWEALINAVSYDDLLSVFKNTVYSRVFEQFSVSAADDSIFKLETALDRLYYREIQKLSGSLSKADKKTVRDIVSTEIDLQNVSWLIRYRHFYNMEPSELSGLLIPGGFGLNLENLSGTEPGSGVSPVDLLKKSYPELSSLNISDKHNFAMQAQLFEQLLEETRKRRFTGILSGYPFTIGIVLVYFFLSEHEFQYISSVLNGKNYGLSASRIEEHLK